MKKMSKYMIITTTVLVACLAPLILELLTANNGREVRLPAETIVREKTDEDEKLEQKEKEEWIEHMHQAAPGTNWRKTDHNTRWKKYTAKLGSEANKSSSSGSQAGYWEEKGSNNQSGRILVAEFDTTTNQIFAASSGGNVWKGDIDGNNWVSLNEQFQMTGITMIRMIHTDTLKRLVVSAGGGYFYFSDDEGMSWDTASGLNGPQDWGGIIRCVLMNDSLHTIYMLAKQWDYIVWESTTCLYKSTDLGQSFALITCMEEGVYGGSSTFDIWAPRSESNTCYLINQDSIYYLDTISGDLNLIANFTVDTLGYTVLTGCKQGGTTYLYAYIAQDIYRSADGGLNWAKQTTLGKNPFNKTSFSCSEILPDKLFFGDYECYRSLDGGISWIKLNEWYDYYGAELDQLHADIPSVISIVDNDGSEFQFICTDGGIYISNDLLQTVQNISLSGLNVSQYYSVYTNKFDPNFIYIGSQDQGFQRSYSDPGGIIDFDQVISGDYGHIVSSNEGLSIWMVYPGFADYYADGMTGTFTSWWDFNSTIPFWIPPLMADPFSPNTCYLAGGYLDSSGSHMIKLEVIGTTMNETEMPYDFSIASGGGDISAMAYSTVDPSIWYVSTDNGQIFHSTDAGVNWVMTSSFSGPGPHYFYGSDIHPSHVDAATVYIAGSGYSNPPVYFSTDTGNTFTAMDDSLPSTLVFQLASDANDSILYAATEVGAYAYSFIDSLWFDLADTIAPDQRYWSVEYIPVTNTARFASYGRGIWDYIAVPPDTTTPIGMSEQPGRMAFVVYPNPAAGWISIDYYDDLEADSGVEIIIYDIKGKKLIAKKVDKSMRNSLVISVENLSKGVYFIRINSDSGSVVRKFVKS